MLMMLTIADDVSYYVRKVSETNKYIGQKSHQQSSASSAAEEKPVLQVMGPPAAYRITGNSDREYPLGHVLSA